MLTLEQQLRAIRNNPLLFDGTVLEQEQLSIELHNIKKSMLDVKELNSEPKNPSWVSAYYL